MFILFLLLDIYITFTGQFFYRKYRPYHLHWVSFQWRSIMKWRRKGTLPFYNASFWDFSLPLYWFPCNYYTSGRNTYYCYSYIGVYRRVNPYKKKIVIIVMYEAFETPAPPIRAWVGHSLFMQVKVSEVPGSREWKWVVHSPAPTFQHMVLPL